MAIVKKTFQFTLVLKNVDDKTEGLEDSLYHAGCDDALINFRNGIVFLDFDRADISLERAAFKAIKELESSAIRRVIANIVQKS